MEKIKRNTPSPVGQRPIVELGMIDEANPSQMVSPKPTITPTSPAESIAASISTAIKNKTVSSANKIKALAGAKKDELKVVSTTEVQISKAVAESHTYFSSGLLLVRRYNTGSTSVDTQCGPVSYWQTLLNQQRNNVSGLDTSTDNKFQRRVRLTIIENNMGFTYPQDPGVGAITWRYGGTGSIYSSIEQKYLPNQSARERMVMHELGHAYHNYIDLLGQTNNPNKPVFMNWFSKYVTNPSIAYSPGVTPWTNGRNPEELFADAFRYHMGTPNSQVIETLPAGFKNPSTMPEQKTQLKLMPDLTNYWNNFGVNPNTLLWSGSATSGYFQFQNSSNQYIRLTAAKQWQIWTPPQNGNPEYWTNFNPQYTIP